MLASRRPIGGATIAIAALLVQKNVSPNPYLKYLDCVEVYNDQTGLWDTTDIKLNKPNMEFSCLNIKLKDIISHSQLQSTKD